MRPTRCVLIGVLAALGCAAEDDAANDRQATQSAGGQGGMTAGGGGGGGGAAGTSPAGGGSAGQAGSTPLPTGGIGGAAAVSGQGGSSMVAGAGGTGMAGTAAGAGGAGMPAPSSGCGVPWTASDAQLEQGRRGQPMRVARREITINGVQRLYLLAVPPDYDPATAYPLVFGFHGFGGDREQLRGYMNVEVPAAGQAIFLYPEGLVIPDRGDTGWNTSGESDDLAFVDALLAQYTSELCIDQARIFATGHSYGGCMSNAVGCFRGDVLRAIAPVAGCGPFSRRGGTACAGQVAALLIHSPSDTTTEYASGISGCTHWLRANACDEMPACGCHWVEALEAPEDACMQEAQQPYEPGVPVEVAADDDAPPAFRSYLNCDPGYPVVFVDHYNRENRSGQEERWHNPPPWAPAVIWQFFSTLPAVDTPP